jgi:hypothetical protein
MRYILKASFVFLFSFTTLTVFAQSDTIVAPEAPLPARQTKDKVPFKDRIYFGGNLGLQFGTQTYIDISPLVGYKITEKLSAGIGATYIYYSYKDRYFSYKTNIYGGRIFGRYFFTDNLFAHTEVELINMELFDNVRYDYYRKNILSPLVGGGYIQRFSENSGVYIMLLLNLNDSAESPYSNPIIRIGFNIGL